MALSLSEYPTGWGKFSDLVFILLENTFMQLPPLPINRPKRFVPQRKAFFVKKSSPYTLGGGLQVE